jgi:hypothetical protein
VLLVLVLLFASAQPGSTSEPGEPCAAVAGWGDGRGGRPADPSCARSTSYAEAHRLGDAMHALETERAAIVAELPSVDEASRAIRLRRQRQIDTDLEALRGLATIRRWPLDSAEEGAR